MVSHFDYREVIGQGDINGSTAIHLATRKGDARMLNYLLGYPEMLNIIDNREMKCVGGYAAIHHACLAGNSICLELLVKAGCDVNIHADSNLGETPLQLCCKHGYIECGRILFSSEYALNVDARDNFGHNASFWAYSKRYEDMIRLLNLPPVRSATAEEYVAIMMKRNNGIFTLPSLASKKPKKKSDKKKK